MKILALAQSGTMQGGANRSFLMVLGHLKKMYGYEIHVITPNHGAFNESLNELEIPNSIVRYHSISGVKSFSPINTYRWLRFHWYRKLDIKMAQKLAKTIKHENYDLVYVNDTDVYFGAFLAECLDIPFVWHFRSFIDAKMHFISNAWKMFDGCAQIISISQGMEATLLDNPTFPHNKITVIHNGIPLPEPLCLSEASRKTGLHMVQCGRITPEKGHKDSIRAVALLKKKGINDIYLHIVGAVPGGGKSKYLQELYDMIEQFGLKDAVFFDGECDDMNAFRANMHVELMCSVCEPFGRVTLEGMRCGITVIGSNTGGTPEIITDGVTGLLYKQGDPDNLSEKILRIYEDEPYARELAKNAANFSLTHFTPEQNVSEIEKVLKNAVVKRR